MSADPKHVSPQVLLGNPTNAPSAPMEIPLNGLTFSNGSLGVSSITISALLDAAFGANQGMVLYRDASLWMSLAPGTAGQVFESGGVGANPSWVTIAAGGTVTSVTFTGDGTVFNATPTTPVTTTGTMTPTLNTQVANASFAGPVSGAAAAPTFRQNVAADIPKGIIYAFASRNLIM